MYNYITKKLIVARKENEEIKKLLNKAKNDIQKEIYNIVLIRIDERIKIYKDLQLKFKGDKNGLRKSKINM